jgi:CDP-diacylglycerol--glycerol-3-phosphate 3-phosphatidyltransferase
VGTSERVSYETDSPSAAETDRGSAGRWLSPANALTLLRVVLVPVIAALVFTGDETARWWAFAIFVFAAVTDSIDGWLARREVGGTRWGALADPAADKLLIAGSLAVLAVINELPWWAVAVIVARELVVTVQRTVLDRGGVTMVASVPGKAKTISQIVAIACYLVPSVPDDVAFVALLVAVALTVASGLAYALQATPPRRAPAGRGD